MIEAAVALGALTVIVGLIVIVGMVLKFITSLQTGHMETMRQMQGVMVRQSTEYTESMKGAFEQMKDVSVEGIASARAGIGEIGKALNPPVPPATQATNIQTPIISDEQLQEVYDKFDWTDGHVGGERPGTAPLGVGEEIPGIGLGSGDAVAVEPVDFGSFDMSGEDYDG